MIGWIVICLLAGGAFGWLFKSLDHSETDRWLEKYEALEEKYAKLRHTAEFHKASFLLAQHATADKIENFKLPEEYVASGLKRAIGCKIYDYDVMTLTRTEVLAILGHELLRPQLDVGSYDPLGAPMWRIRR